MEYEAKCLCGKLRIKVIGQPNLVLTCNCFTCQRRTGSAFGFCAYFKEDQIIQRSGEVSHFHDIADSGRTVINSFCPNCGTTVYWNAELIQDTTGISAGCFENPDFPEPTLTTFCQSKHGWVKYPDDWTKY